MDSGYYAAMTGLVARTQALDTAASNLANASTPGYRAEREFFRSVLLGPDALDSQLGETVNNYGLLGGDRLSLAQGALEQTGNPLDLAIEGQGFFEIQTPHGVRFTRDGGFHRARSGQLVTEAGEPVLSSGGQPIPVPPGEVT
ncbi:MAG: flagellar hook basal-body protein, partial [Terracidiphilus sp.]